MLAARGGASTPRYLEIRWDKDNYATTLGCSFVLTQSSSSFVNYNFRLPSTIVSSIAGTQIRIYGYGRLAGHGE